MSDEPKVIATIDAGSTIKKINGRFVVCHPEREPCILHIDGTKEILKADFNGEPVVPVEPFIDILGVVRGKRLV